MEQDRQLEASDTVCAVEGPFLVVAVRLVSYSSWEVIGPAVARMRIHVMGPM